MAQARGIAGWTSDSFRRTRPVRAWGRPSSARGRFQTPTGSHKNERHNRTPDTEQFMPQTGVMLVREYLRRQSWKRHVQGCEATHITRPPYVSNLSSTWAQTAKQKLIKEAPEAKRRGWGLQNPRPFDSLLVRRAKARDTVGDETVWARAALLRLVRAGTRRYNRFSSAF